MLRSLRAARFVLVLTAIAAVLGALGVAACGGGFDPQNKVDSLRLFAVRADKPYAKPGEEVTLEALYGDARKDKTRPAKNYWIPVVCLNPRDDLYYACFIPPSDAGAATNQTRLIPVGAFADAGAAAGDAGGAGGGAGGGFGGIPQNVDLAPFLPEGPTFKFRMPEDAIQERKGSAPYGLAIVFNITCSGRVTFAGRDGSGAPQQLPLRCTDEEGNQLPPSDYVIGISRVYAYAERTNTNPVIEKVTLEGADVNLAAGITIETCKASKRMDCKDNKIDVRVSEASWEENPGSEQGVLREQIWVTYYTDVGEFENDARLLFDSTKGRVSESENKYRASNEPKDGTIWAVVHDNRGGAAWVTIPVRVR